METNQKLNYIVIIIIETKMVKLLFYLLFVNLCFNCVNSEESEADPISMPDPVEASVREYEWVTKFIGDLDYETMAVPTELVT